MQQPLSDIVVERPDDVTPEWLTAVLQAGTVTGLSFERIGTGQMSECYRFALSYADGSAGPATVVLKVAAADPTSRQTGLALGLYEREVRFYTDIAPRISGPVAHCYHASIDPQTGIFDLLIDDAAPAQVGDEIRGATRDQALLAMAELGRLHRSLQGEEALAGAEWLNRDAPVNGALIGALYAGFTERYGESMTADQREVCERLVASFDAYLAAEGAQERPMGLVHGDYRLDNMLFGEAGAQRPLTVVDWQTVTWGPAFTDLAYFLGCALPAETRRAHVGELLAAYHQALGPDTALSLDDVSEGVRRQSFFGVMMAIVSSMLVERTERGDEMFLTMLERHCAQVLDTRALEVLPSAAQEPLQPSESDENPHVPDGDALWNESWYFDFADTAVGLGGWVRLGLYPNEGKAWINALLCGPGLPTIALNDFAAAVPENPYKVHADGIELGFEALEPLQKFRVTVTGTGQVYDDPAALLTGAAGRPVRVSMDLVWSTDGVPYRYRMATRYEIPCTVSGSVTVDGEVRHFNGAPGQRDHSWGVRDWWSMDWVWSALHLDDGTHLHAVQIRIPGIPAVSVGYSQAAGAPVVDLTDVGAREVLADNGLPVSTELTLQPGGLQAVVEPVGHAPVRLVADDGRVAHFPRAWVSVKAADGRTGVGWVEWNRNLG
ncbi:MAG TPA: phosphotransferase [Mycobacterium sp.]|nr:phosphotransferase [Mycobacterium sp.]